MNKKSEARLIGRNIRRATGLPLPIAMGMGKFVAREGAAPLGWSKFSSHVKHEDNGCDCCGSWPVGVFGPKGDILFSDLSKDTGVRREKTPEPTIRTILVKVSQVDASLTCLRARGIAAMIETGKVVYRDTLPLVSLAINVSKRKARKIFAIRDVLDRMIEDDKGYASIPW